MGVEGISKEQNLGNLVRSSHSFGAEFFFTIRPDIKMKDVRMSDTSEAHEHMPFYNYDSLSDLKLPRGCDLVGVEFLEDSIELPSFKHPTRAAYILGPEMGNLSDEVLDMCRFTIKIPMKFCVNVGVAGALVMNDRMISLGRFAPRPVKAGGPTEELKQEKFGLRRFSRKAKTS